MFVDGATFKVTPGAEYEFSAVLDVPQASFGSGFVAVMFIDQAEVHRENLWFEALPIVLPAATTDADGGYHVRPRGLDAGRYAVTIDYDGDVEHWAARAQATIRLR